MPLLTLKEHQIHTTFLEELNAVVLLLSMNGSGIPIFLIKKCGRIQLCSPSIWYERGTPNVCRHYRPWCSKRWFSDTLPNAGSLGSFFWTSDLSRDSSWIRTVSKNCWYIKRGIKRSSSPEKRSAYFGVIGMLFTELKWATYLLLFD